MNASNSIRRLERKLADYTRLIKSRQTGLLLVTGIAGYISARSPAMRWETIVGLIGSLLLAISGSTVLNMVYDRDIDARMKRTERRPLPSGKISSEGALLLGFALAIAGLLWAFRLSYVYGFIVYAGLFFDVIVYTAWLKRKTPWSIVWGGISGGMPILAGRALSTGRIDYIGVLLSLSILLWIPTHILTFSISRRHYNDYTRASIPAFPIIYGFRNTRKIIALASLGAAVSIGLGCYALGLAGGYLRLLAVLTVGIIGLAVFSLYRPSEKIDFGLFKYASLYMLGSMLMMVLGSLK